LLRLQRLKKRKLQLRDRIAFIEDQIHAGYHRLEHDPDTHCVSNNKFKRDDASS